MSRLIKAADPAELTRIVSLRRASLPACAPLEPAESALIAAPAASTVPAVSPLPAYGDLRVRLEGALRPADQAEERREFEETIAGLRAQLERAREEADQREESAFERGLREGREEAERYAERRTALLAETLAALQQDQSARTAEVELLALQIAKAALGRIVGDRAERSALIAESVAHHLGQIDRDLVLAVRVSPQDFAEEEPWAALAEDLPAIALERDGTLASGECRANLKLGTLDLGLSGQWQRLTDLFDSLAETGDRP